MNDLNTSPRIWRISTNIGLDSPIGEALKVLLRTFDNNKYYVYFYCSTFYNTYYLPVLSIYLWIQTHSSKPIPIWRCFIKKTDANLKKSVCCHPLGFRVPIQNPVLITVTLWCGRWRLKLPVSRFFTHVFIQTQIKENVKAPRHWPLWGKFTGEFPIQRASNAEKASIWWRHHVVLVLACQIISFAQAFTKCQKNTLHDVNSQKQNFVWYRCENTWCKCWEILCK